MRMKIPGILVRCAGTITFGLLFLSQVPTSLIAENEHVRTGAHGSSDKRGTEFYKGRYKGACKKNNKSNDFNSKEDLFLIEFEVTFPGNNKIAVELSVPEKGKTREEFLRYFNPFQRQFYPFIESGEYPLEERKPPRTKSKPAASELEIVKSTFSPQTIDDVEKAEIYSDAEVEKNIDATPSIVLQDRIILTRKDGGRALPYVEFRMEKKVYYEQVQRQALDFEPSWTVTYRQDSDQGSSPKLIDPRNMLCLLKGPI